MIAMPGSVMARSNSKHRPSLRRLLLGRRLSPEEKERRRFYLLPGMGGRAYFRKQRRIRLAALAVGLVVSALVALLLWILNSQPFPR
ncbi:hypothetical protein G4L39_12645 [Limisphaera ngatamarikiensis]|jgi:hypothetical protein|uniref:Uncharacterized protein n=1 Tax=Limisphaera ngatamarikiensis TaxID=1324935 RepID=A0A6M1RUC8_9BACT|nr:hypothetical protein [Limisphaera ngatamarikiensis]NGO40235.1 hypothetical protein [Limisphaera ngatamarikiensis]